jgi:hypothetical protein
VGGVDGSTSTSSWIEALVAGLVLASWGGLVAANFRGLTRRVANSRLYAWMRRRPFGSMSDAELRLIGLLQVFVGLAIAVSAIAAVSNR